MHSNMSFTKKIEPIGFVGPLGFKTEKYDGSVPNLILRPHSWTKV